MTDTKKVRRQTTRVVVTDKEMPLLRAALIHVAVELQDSDFLIDLRCRLLSASELRGWGNGSVSIQDMKKKGV